MAGIHKRFGPVLANGDVNLSVRAGTVHGLVGENGAGKSTLMSVLYGFYAADSGSIEVFGQPARIRNAHEVGVEAHEETLGGESHRCAPRADAGSS